MMERELQETMMEEMNSQSPKVKEQSYGTVFVHRRAGRNLDFGVQRAQLRIGAHAAGSEQVGCCGVPTPGGFRLHRLEDRPPIARSAVFSVDAAGSGPAEQHWAQAGICRTDRFA